MREQRAQQAIDEATNGEFLVQEVCPDADCPDRAVRTTDDNDDIQDFLVPLERRNAPDPAGIEKVILANWPPLTESIDDSDDFFPVHLLWPLTESIDDSDDFFPVHLL